MGSHYNMRIGNFYFMACFTKDIGNIIHRMEIDDNTLLSTESIYSGWNALGMLVPN